MKEWGGRCVRREMDDFPYFIPLSAGLAFVIIGLYCLRASPETIARWRKDKDDTSPPRRAEVMYTRAFAGLLFAGGTALAVTIVFLSPSLGERRGAVARCLRT